mmetsp:Transcript_7328/g.21614  ORF Transcript_7328/g.21614 Transcript_7328/m.21614 type:complete len:223 (+) Transcript_7328:1286-1954(+)
MWRGKRMRRGMLCEMRRGRRRRRQKQAPWMDSPTRLRPAARPRCSSSHPTMILSPSEGGRRQRRVLARRRRRRRSEPPAAPWFPPRPPPGPPPPPRGRGWRQQVQPRPSIRRRICRCANQRPWWRRPRPAPQPPWLPPAPPLEWLRKPLRWGRTTWRWLKHTAATLLPQLRPRKRRNFPPAASRRAGSALARVLPLAQRLQDLTCRPRGMRRSRGRHTHGPS